MPTDATLRIDPADPADSAAAAAFAAIYGPIVADTSISFETDPPDAAEMQRRVAATVPRYPWLVARDDRGIAGYAYAGPFRSRAAYQWCAEVSVYVAADRRGTGVGRSLYAALLDDLRERGFRMAYGGATLPNPGSVALHRGAGFESVGTFARAGWKFGGWHDVAWWQIDLAAGSDRPPRPLDHFDG